MKVKYLFYTIYAILIPLIVYAATFTISTSGNWSNTGTWSGGVLPGITDDVSMNNNRSVTIQNGDNYEVVSIATANGNTINIDLGGTLTLSNPGATALTAQNNEVINVDGDFIIDGDLVVNNNLIFNVSATGSVTVTGDVIINNGASLDIAGTVQIDGDLTGGNNTGLTVDGSLTVDGPGGISVGNGSSLDGTGTVSSPGGCDPPASAFCMGDPLPIELIYFEGASEKNQIRLFWASATEENFDFYTIEKSLDGYEFFTIGDLKGQGGFLQTQEYAYIDEVPSSGINYYRLKSTDLDGTIEYHKVIGVNFDGQVIDGIKVYPNPSYGQITVRSTHSSAKGLIEIYTTYGEKIYQAPMNSIAISIKLPTDISPGVYLVRCIASVSISESRLVIK